MSKNPQASSAQSEPTSTPTHEPDYHSQKPKHIPIPIPFQLHAGVAPSRPFSDSGIETSAFENHGSGNSLQSSALLSPPLTDVFDFDAPYRPKEDDTVSLDQHHNRRPRKRHKRRISNERSKQFQGLSTAAVESKLLSTTKNYDRDWNWDHLVDYTDSESGTSQATTEPSVRSLGLSDQVNSASPGTFARSVIGNSARRNVRVGKDSHPTSKLVTAHANISSSSVNIPDTSLSETESTHYPLASWKPLRALRHRKKPSTWSVGALARRDTPASITLRKASVAYSIGEGTKPPAVSHVTVSENSNFREHGVLFRLKKGGSRPDSGTYWPTTWTKSSGNTSSPESSSCAGHGQPAFPAISFAHIHVSISSPSPEWRGSATRKNSLVERSVMRLNSVLRVNTEPHADQQIIWSQEDPLSDSSSSPLSHFLASAMASQSSLVTKTTRSRMGSIAEDIEPLAPVRSAGDKMKAIYEACEAGGA